MKIGEPGILILLIYLPILILQLYYPFRKKFSKVHAKDSYSKVIEILTGVLYFLMILIGIFIERAEDTIFLFVGSLIYIISLIIVYFGYSKYFRSKGLITRFPFNISRNPTYFYGFIAILGIIIMTKSLILLVILIIQIFLVHKIIINEEKYLEKEYYKKYIDYKKRVRRYI